ncbi:hypothetical protein [uncultured Thiodictyon sp.]|uniref:hypothetical protein n=1 Tax=uncultured Thiodictyon sp. TaxID=1846217 RepID=UPI0025D1D90B|nr:hypothetical protein [uncultured Thiodictyon sp.]
MRHNTLNGLAPLALMAAILSPAPVSAECGPRDEAAQQTCKTVHAKALPAELRKYLAKSGCDVKTGSNYDEGYAVDLNADGNLEYAYCCSSAPHGPCGMKVFASVSGKWTALSDEVYFPADTETPCDGFVPLASKSAGYNDVCVGGGDTVLKFSRGSYVE